MRSFIVTSGSAQLAAVASGGGAPLLFLHAGVADRRMWGIQLSAFENDYNVVAYDRRGFGETMSEPEPHSEVEDLQAVLDAVGRGSPILVGCSQGGRVAIDYALSRPVAALVLVAPAVSGAPQPDYSPGSIADLLSALEAAEDAGNLDDVNRLEAHLWLDGPQSREGRVGGDARRLFLDMNGIALRAGSPGAKQDDADACSRLAEIDVPVLLVCGDLDFPHIRERCAFLRRSLPQVEFVEMPRTAHLPSLEQPEAFNAILARFLQRPR